MSKRSKAAGFRIGARVFIIRPPHNSKKMSLEDNIYDKTGVITREGNSLNGGWFEVLLDGNEQKYVYYRRGSMELISDESVSGQLEDPTERRKVLETIKEKAKEKEKERERDKQKEKDRIKSMRENERKRGDQSESDDSEDESESESESNQSESDQESSTADEESESDDQEEHKRGQKRLRVASDVHSSTEVDRSFTGRSRADSFRSHSRQRHPVEEELNRIFRNGTENTDSEVSPRDNGRDKNRDAEESDGELEEEEDEIEKRRELDAKRRRFVQPAIPATPPSKPQVIAPKVQKLVSGSALQTPAAPSASTNSIPSPLFHPHLVSYLHSSNPADEDVEFEFDFDELLSTGSATDATNGLSLPNSNLSSPAIGASAASESPGNSTISLDSNPGKVSARKKSSVRRSTAPQPSGSSSMPVAGGRVLGEMSDQLRGIFHSAPVIQSNPKQESASKHASKVNAKSRPNPSDSEEDYCCASCRVSSSSVWRLAELQNRPYSLTMALTSPVGSHSAPGNSTIQLLLCDSCSRNYLLHRVNCWRCYYVFAGEDLNELRCPQCRAVMPERLLDDKSTKSPRNLAIRRDSSVSSSLSTELAGHNAASSAYSPPRTLKPFLQPHSSAYLYSH